MLFYLLNKDIQCEQICKDLQNMFNKLRNEGVDISNKVLTIKVADISATIDPTPLIEYKES
jgi:hypothetical protein